MIECTSAKCLARYKELRSIFILIKYELVCRQMDSSKMIQNESDLR